MKVENPLLQLQEKKKMVVKKKFNSLFINEPSSEQMKTKVMTHIPKQRHYI